MVLLPPRIEDLIDFGAATLRVTSREGKHREFKQQFNTADFSRYTKALAAFCNTDGGVLIFGVAEKPNRIEGVDLATIPDEASWTDRLRKDFDPEIPFETREYQIGEKSLFALAVEPHVGRPVICKRDVTAKVEKRGKSTDETVIQQGGIYYRQSGQTRPIAFTELQTLLQERDERRLQAFLENVQIMQKIGPERVGIVDASKTAAPGETTKLYVSREVAKSLNFIDKGRFVETEEDGSPAFVVAGTVQLNEVIVGPLDDADKNLPNEAAEQIKPVVEELFGAGSPFTGHHLAKLARHLGIRDGEETDQRYCVHDKKLKRTFYLRAGIQHAIEKLREQPEECLRSFASKPVIEAYEKQLHEAAE
jgi:hypothetical protein